jgi:hypothetical protein
VTKLRRRNVSELRAAEFGERLRKGESGAPTSFVAWARPTVSRGFRWLQLAGRAPAFEAGSGWDSNPKDPLNSRKLF